MHNRDMPWFDDQYRCAFGLKQEVHHRLPRDRSRVNYEEVILCQVRTNELYLEAKRQFIVTHRDVLMNDQSQHKWWYTIKPEVFGSFSSLPPLVGGGV